MSDGTDRNRLLVALAGLGFSLWGGTMAFFAPLVLERISRVEAEIANGVLPRADERIRDIEERHVLYEQQLERIQAEINRHLIEDH